MQSPKMLAALFGVVVRGLTLPNDLVNKVVLPKDHIQHDLNVMRGVPVAVIVKRSRLLQDSRYLDTPRPHKFDVRLSRFVTILKGTLLLRLAPKNFVVAIGVERRIDVAKIN